MSQLDQEKMQQLEDRTVEWGLFFFLLVVFLSLMVYGVYLGNVFETYQNGSNL
jgi:hypothetical protein